MKRRKVGGKAAEAEMRNAAKTLLANIRFAGVDSPIRTVVVTSSVPDEGKSTVSVALAEAMAESGASVLLVDCDFRRRSLPELTGARPLSGVCSVVSGDAALEDAAVPTRIPGVSLLGAEAGVPSPADVLSSRKFGSLVGRLTARFGYVVFDTPPVCAFVDAAVVASLADATVLVVRDGFTRRADLVAAKGQLDKAGANIVGVALNDCEPAGGGYYYYDRYAQAEAEALRSSEEDLWEDLDGFAPEPPRTGRHGR